MTQDKARITPELNKVVIRNVSDLVARDLRKIDAMDDNSLLCALNHNISAILRKKRDSYDSRVLLHTLDLIKERLMHDKEAHADLLPIAVVMARVPATSIRDTAYLAEKLKDVIDAHIAKGQANEWKALLP